MANPLRKTMVYLGLADEELEYDAPATEQPQRQAPVAPVPHPQAPQAAQSQPTHSSSQGNRAPVTPLRKTSHTSHSKNVAPAEMNEILTVHPKQYKDAQVIAENFREGIPVIMNLSQMTDADARRLIDFAGGLSQGLYGKIERVTSKVFLLSPSHVSVSGDAGGEARAESSFFVQS
jgi:cell division inhibitor SepF